MDKVLRASKAGFPCLRNLWYSVNQFDGITSQYTQRIFDVGTYLEPLVVEWLRSEGWDVEYNQGSQNAELELFVPLDGGSLAGHPDCFISRGDVKDVLVDIKTMNDRAFTQWKREGSLKSKPQYVDQLHIYAMGCIRTGRKITKLGIVGVNKNNSDMHIDFFDFDFARAADIQDRAMEVFSAEQPPVKKSPAETWCCNYCEFEHLCERKGMKPDTPEIEENVLTQDISADDLSTAQAIRDLLDARDLAKHARTMEADAKQSLLAISKAKGTDTLNSNGMTCSIIQKPSQHFDSKGFKAAYPEIAQQFTSESYATYFDVKGDF